MTEPIEIVELEKEEEFPIMLTEAASSAALNAIKEEGLSPEHGLRIGLRGGGCAGFEYVLDFEDKPRFSDFVFVIRGLKVFVDPISATHLEGTKIDFVTHLMNTGFKFINPNAKKTCGCGSSFG